MRRTITGQRRGDRARRTFAVGMIAAAIPLAVPLAATPLGWSLGTVQRAGLIATTASAALIGWVLLRVTRRMERESTRFEAERRRWRDEAFTDPLCGVANRRGAAHEIEFRRLTAAPSDRLWVMALDIDRFKKVNDDHGHAVGDRVLVAVADVLADRLPAGAVVARWGGDEFVVFQIGDHDLVDGWGEAIAEAVASQPIPVRDGELRVSVSFGFASGPVTSDFEHLLDEADEALLKAKSALGHRSVRVPTTVDHSAAVDVRELAPKP